MDAIYLEIYDHRLHGWECRNCQAFIKAIGRERRFRDGTKTANNGDLKKESR
jgi:hypothetical protein